MLTYALFIIGFVFLVKGADLLVDGSASIAKKLNVPSIVIGLTIVAFGTSTPELIVNIIASAKGNTEIAIGNIIGSNIFNILFILGISAAICPLTTKKNTVWKEIPLGLLAAILLAIMANDGRIEGGSFSGLSRIDGIILIAFFIIFLYYTFGIAKATGESDGGQAKILNYTVSSAYIVIGLLGLVIGGKWIVDGAVKIAQSFGVSESLVGLTIVAAGTSLPELATSAVAAYKKQMDIAIGNVVGSNIFNIFWVLGVSSIIRPLPFSASSDIDNFMNIFASAILFAIMFIGKKHIVERWQGILMLLIYVGYVVFLVLNK